MERRLTRPAKADASEAMVVEGGIAMESYRAPKGRNLESTCPPVFVDARECNLERLIGAAGKECAEEVV